MPPVPGFLWLRRPGIAMLQQARRMRRHESGASCQLRNYEDALSSRGSSTKRPKPVCKKYESSKEPQQPPMFSTKYAKHEHGCEQSWITKSENASWTALLKPDSLSNILRSWNDSNLSCLDRAFRSFVSFCVFWSIKQLFCVSPQEKLSVHAAACLHSVTWRCRWNHH